MARIPSFNTTAFFVFLVKFRQLATKINPVRPLGRNLKKELPEHLPYFLEKKRKKKEEFARFRQWVHVACLDLGRIAEKTLLSAKDSRHLM